MAPMTLRQGRAGRRRLEGGRDTSAARAAGIEARVRVTPRATTSRSAAGEIPGLLGADERESDCSSTSSGGSEELGDGSLACRIFPSNRRRRRVRGAFLIKLSA